MYKINNKIYKQLLKKDVHEECGILAGKAKRMSKIYDTENKHKEKNMFKIGFIDKMKIGYDGVINNGFDNFIPFHVHTKGLAMSVTDVEYARVGSFNIVICERKLGLFKVIKTKTGKTCIPITYEIIGGKKKINK